MMRYYFHATDGYAAVFDDHGLIIRPDDVERTAALAANALRRHFGMLADLSEWQVVVYDDRGDEMEAYAFDDLPRIVEQDLVAA